MPGKEPFFENIVHITGSKVGLFSEDILTLNPLSKKGAKSLPWAENLNKLFTEKGGKFKLSPQGRNLAPFVGNGTKVKIPSNIKQPLPDLVKIVNYLKFSVWIRWNDVN